MSLYLNHPECLVVLYDLRIPGAFKQAHDDRKAWGKQCADVYPMSLDHVLLVFRPGGAYRLAS